MMAEGTAISMGAAASMRGAITLAGGREVCFVATLDERGTIATARAVARGDARSVLSLPGCARRGEMLVHNHPSGALEPSPADMEVAHSMYLEGVGFGIVNNDVTQVYVVVEVPIEREPALLSPDKIAADLGATGAVGKLLESYEERPSQSDLARHITNLYNRGGVGVLEAGTGVGKSLAYLVPALRWAAANGDRTVVSTNTINLQEQIVGNDLPFLARALSDQKVRFTLLKGWRNYICLQRLDNATAEAVTLFDDDTAAEFKHLTEWAHRSPNGSLSDLPVQPRADVWDEIAAEPDLCTRHRCKYFDDCFVFRARREAAKADVVVVNHHLLMADISVRRAQQNWSDAAVIPSYNYLVVDEGHHLEDAASKHLGVSVTRRGVSRLLSRLERRGKGLLATLQQRFSSSRGALESASHDLIHARLFASVETARRTSAEVFDLLDSYLSETGLPTVRVTEDLEKHRVWKGGLDASLNSLVGEFNILAGALEKIKDRIASVDSEESNVSVLSELRGVTRRLTGAGDALHTTLKPGKGAEPSVRWIESKGGEGNISAATVPLDLSGILRDDLFHRVKTIIVTSATLNTGGSFDFIRGRLGLNEPDVEPTTASFPSAFHYQDQAILAVPNDLPIPGDHGDDHREAVLQVITALARLSDGGIFVLCTSHRDIRFFSAALRGSDTSNRWPLLVQGEGESRDAILGRFRESGRAILLGAASFWEGVDVRGVALRGMVIVKLPFRVPTEPVTAAHCEAIAAAGGDPFSDYLLPHAALRLKQGFGRLIRSSKDWGAVVITDSRLALRNYGESLIESLPPASRVIGPWSEVSDRLTKFYGQRRE